MPDAIARYDLIVTVCNGISSRREPVVVDMIENRDEGPDGSPGRLRGAKLKHFSAPAGIHIAYERVALAGRSRWFLLVNGSPQTHMAKDRRWLRWIDG